MGMGMWSSRLLRETDTKAYRDVRLRALQEVPKAFG
ncbi:hypothetical protein EDC32_102283 [Laceyella sacchari]|jgi:hypothetical protein|nr:hypothetical protein EDC32_102283 [Laceyella sacchari]